jgi:hypothetical protein
MDQFGHCEMVRAATSLRSFDGQVKSSTTRVSRTADELEEVEDAAEEEEVDEMVEAEDVAVEEEVEGTEEVEDDETNVELDD